VPNDKLKQLISQLPSLHIPEAAIGASLGGITGALLPVKDKVNRKRKRLARAIKGALGGALVSNLVADRAKRYVSNKVWPAQYDVEDRVGDLKPKNFKDLYRTLILDKPSRYGGIADESSNVIKARRELFRRSLGVHGPDKETDLFRRHVTKGDLIEFNPVEFGRARSDPEHQLHTGPRGSAYGLTWLLGNYRPKKTNVGGRSGQVVTDRWDFTLSPAEKAELFDLKSDSAYRKQYLARYIADKFMRPVTFKQTFLDPEADADNRNMTPIYSEKSGQANTNVPSSGIDWNAWYRGITNAETAGETNKWIRTKKPENATGSTAYGPAQLTTETLNDFLSRHPDNFKGIAKPRIENFKAQGKMFSTYGSNPHSGFDGTKLEGYDPRYEYGGKGTFLPTNEARRAKAQQDYRNMVIAVGKGMYKDLSKDGKKLTAEDIARRWRGKAMEDGYRKRFIMGHETLP